MSRSSYEAVSPSIWLRDTSELLFELPARLRARQLARKAERSLANKDLVKAYSHAMRAHTICTKAWRPYSVLADILFQGLDYLSFLSLVHQKLMPSRYLEVGVQTGRSIALANESTLCVGIDPAPMINRDIRSKCRIFPLPSDNFFERFDLRSELEGDAPDLVFLDGLHTFEQLLRDFINTEKNSKPETLVFMHDCLPVFRKTAEKEPFLGFWCGDVWKIVPCLKKFRPDLQVDLIKAPPSGLVVVRGLNPRSSVLSDSFEQIVREIDTMKLSYDVLSLHSEELHSCLNSSPDTVELLVAKQT